MPFTKHALDMWQGLGLARGAGVRVCVLQNQTRSQSHLGCPGLLLPGCISEVLDERIPLP